ncbi:MAG: ATP-binding cassette domain-containing protein [Lachnospiraceae bacterium]|nr:ATP-binding cassette domain-containing protein [Lachnospiraceae bacterium]MDD7077594.1 ATP-binding cassette domain-containing protein [Lachnospiraceae bacterium]MDY3729738.1 ATP-binding cassette domain-containing protein [Candidatus Choladocola sp.]
MEPIIKIQHLNKEFKLKETDVHALSDVSLDIYKGDIYGIIGMSGAGKSTLVRCLNFLERPTSGKVIVDGKDLAELSEKQLREARKNIGMIFQHFNLLMQRSVIDNVCFPMEIAGLKKKEAREKAMEYLKIVGLEEKAYAYPAQLSGGQKQRVAIARVLASDPTILLCDEATSALDPQTTKSILQLLKEINQKYGITIVVITHEMAVVQEICSHVAIIDHGKLAEHGTVEQIFQAPKSKEAKKLIYQGYEKVALMKGKRCVRIVFSENSSFEPVIANMVLAFKTPVNILYANTKDLDGVATGEMILQLPEDDVLGDKMIAYLKNTKLTVEELEDYVG